MRERCAWCGNVSGNKFFDFDSGFTRCFDYYACIRRSREQEQADSWYAEECKRMSERAPA